MDDLVIKRGAQSMAGLVSMQAPDPLGVGGRVVGEPAGEFVARRVANTDDVAFLELAGDLDDADGEQALRARLERFARRRRRRRSRRAAARSGRSSACARDGSRRAPGTTSPPASPARIRVNGSGLVPDAIITEPPACVTCRAAASLLRMPPVPSGLVPAPARPSTCVVDLGDERHQLRCVPVPGSVR